MRWQKPRLKVIVAGVAISFALTAAVTYFGSVSMPGKSATEPLPELTANERLAEGRMRADLQLLAGEIGPRNTMHPRALARAQTFIEDSLTKMGYDPSRQSFIVDDVECANVLLRIPGEKDKELVVIGAHYDSAFKAPGANDNGTGVVALLELARRLRGSKPFYTIVLAFFTNEEPPHFNTDDMGSRRYAAALHEDGNRVVAMLSLETMGAFTSKPNSQKYPPLIGAFYPDKGNFIAFIGNFPSRGLARRAIRSFREVASVPSEGSTTFESIPGVDWSDHASFWKYDWPAIMVTDTAPYRDPNYHTKDDTPDKVDTGALARVVVGLEHVIIELSKEEN